MAIGKQARLWVGARRALARAGLSLARAAGYWRDEPQRCRLDRQLRLARLYWPSLALELKRQGMRPASALGVLALWFALGALIAAGAARWRPGEDPSGALMAMGAMALCQAAIARGLFLSSTFAGRRAARLEMTGPGGQFEGYLDRSAAERSKAVAMELRATLGVGDGLAEGGAGARRL